ncbi:hypothetical protein [Desulfosarcina sp.]|uniref:hypothetical protein n=1 Tax=Desulfosarcina sp. TaxID=2027861 RepID=UPI003971063E
MLAKKLPGHFNVGKGQAGLLVFCTGIHKKCRASFVFVVCVASQYELALLICQTGKAAPGKSGDTQWLSALAYPTLGGNANVKFTALAPVKMLDWEMPLC